MRPAQACALWLGQLTDAQAHGEEAQGVPEHKRVQGTFLQLVGSAQGDWRTYKHSLKGGWSVQGPWQHPCLQAAPQRTGMRSSQQHSTAYVYPKLDTRGIVVDLYIATVGQVPCLSSNARWSTEIQCKCPALLCSQAGTSELEEQTYLKPSKTQWGGCSQYQRLGQLDLGGNSMVRRCRQHGQEVLEAQL